MKFSIITVTLNDRLGLEQTIGSVLSQSYLEFELLVQDGGSVDSTVAFLNSITDPRVSWVSRPDQGLYDAMNRGLDRARGDFIIFMNGGDSLADAGVLDDVAAAVSQQPSPDFVYGDSIDVTLEGRQMYKHARDAQSVWRGMFAQHQAMFFARPRIGSKRYKLEFRLSSDYEFISAFLMSGHRDPAPRIIRLARPICRFKLGGRSDRRRWAALSEDFHIRREMGLSTLSCGFLWAAHLLHLLLKRLTPTIAEQMRYDLSR